jgi:hypothetical protein
MRTLPLWRFLGVLLPLTLHFTGLAGEELRQTGTLQDASGHGVAGASFQVFAFSRAAGKFVAIASGKTGKDGAFSCPEGSKAKREPDPLLFADIPGGGHFAADLRMTESGPLVVKAYGPWEDLVVTFKTPDGQPASGLHGRIAQLSDPKEDFFTEVPQLPAGTWDATTNEHGQLTLRGFPARYRLYLEMDDARYAQLMGALSSRYWLPPGRPQTVNLIPAGSAAGKVTLPDGQPAKRVSIRVLEQYNYDEAGGGGGTATTDAEGRYSIGRLRPAIYDIQATLPPESTEQYATPIRSGVRLKLAENAVNQDLALTKGVLVSGKDRKFGNWKTHHHAIDDHRPGALGSIVTARPALDGNDRWAL